MTGPAEKSSAGEKHSGGLAQLVRWLNEERPITGDDGGYVPGAPRRVARFVYGEPPVTPPKSEAERDVLGEVRIGPAPRCAVAGETIALSVSLISARGGMYLGWPITLEWSSSDPSVATVSDGGIVEVHAKGRVELTCRCEGKSGSVLLTVVEPAVAAAVGLPVPARLLPASRPDSRPAERTAVEEVWAEYTRVEHPPTGQPALQQLPLLLPPQPPPAHRRSIERGSVKRGVIASLAPSRGTRRFLFRLAVGAATGGFVAAALSQSPEEYFVVDAEPTAAMAAQMSVRPPATRRPQTAARTALGTTAAVPAGRRLPASAPLGDTSEGTAMARASGRTVAVAAGTTARPSLAGTSQVKTNASPPTSAPTTPAAAAQAVSRVVVAPSPSQLAEGESVRLLAAGVDDRGDAVAGRAVTWKSEDTEVATVDLNGVVTARRPGTVTILAASDGRTGRVTLTVGARRASAPAETPASAAASTRESTPAAAAQVMRARVDEFVQALRERNSERVAALYRAESPQDRKNLQALLERLRRSEARLKASDAQLGAQEIREMEAAVDFQVPMSWTTPFGRVRSQTATFRAVLEPGDGGWRLVAIRALGKID
ncbi:MAG: Ig-like domain-containing protein [Gemmatimonadaceae bacterium]